MTTNVSGEGGVIERAHRGQSVADWHWIGSLHDQSRPNPASQCALHRHGACVQEAVGLLSFREVAQVLVSFRGAQMTPICHAAWVQRVFQGDVWWSPRASTTS